MSEWLDETEKKICWGCVLDSGVFHFYVMVDDNGGDDDDNNNGNGDGDGGSGWFNFLPSIPSLFIDLMLIEFLFLFFFFSHCLICWSCFVFWPIFCLLNGKLKIFCLFHFFSTESCSCCLETVFSVGGCLMGVDMGKN